MMILTIIIAARVIPAHAGSTHSKPRNPANMVTLTATTDITAHLWAAELPPYPPIFVYDIGVPVRMTDEQLQAWTREAEEGYDVDALKRRGRGRPGRSATPSRVVAVRLTDHEMRVLDDLAASQSLSRSETLRRALMRTTA